MTSTFAPTAPDGKRLRKRYCQHRAHLFTFLDHPEVAPDNNSSEREAAQLRKDAAALRVGAMFGCPAAFVGRRMAFCVYGDAIGVTLPLKDASDLITAGTAAAVRPFGRPAMAEWLELASSTDPAVKLSILVRAICSAQGAAASR